MNNVKGKHKNKQSYANTRTTGKEQYYTNPDVVDLCLEEVNKHVELKGRLILEPAGGTGEFIKGLQRFGIFDEKIISFDIEPKHSLVVEADYLSTDMSSYKDLIAITNPPFGRASSLAKKFFNYSATHCEYICFLVPKSWRKWTTHNSLDKNFHLVSDIEMPKNCFYLPGNEKKKKDVLNTVFQIWQRREIKRNKIKVPDHGLIQKILPKTLPNKQKIVEGANFSMVVFGHSCGRCTDITERVVDHKTTTMYLQIDDQSVKDALREIDYSIYYNNVAYVQALSIQEINFELNNYFGLKNYEF
jgi:predicted RNA methylase